MKFANWLPSTAIILFLAGCSSSKVVTSSGPHPPLSGDQVKIYQHAPSEYEPIGTAAFEVTPQSDWTHTGDANAAFDGLKQEAGQMGANGILLDANTPGTTFTVVANYHGVSYIVPMHKEPLTAQGVAIFVVKQ